MPTIDELAPAPAAADTDELAVSQSGTTRKLTRAQLVSGLQPQIALPAGSLLGCSVAGTGAPETIAIGANLSISGRTLSAAASPFSIPSLPPAQVPGAPDIVPLGQGGQNAGIAYAQFMSGLSALPGIDASALMAKATGGVTTRQLADVLADAVPVEAFGAVGDGQTDDSAAFAAALATGRALHLGPRTYIVNGQFTIAGSAILAGVTGKTVVRRISQAGSGAWILINGPTFRADGIVFDANNNVVQQESWGLLVAPSCTASVFSDCVFANSTGPTLGCGLTIQASDPAVTQHVVRGCETYGNQSHGIWVQAVDGVQILGCRAHDNLKFGICVDFNDPTFQVQARKAQIIGNACWNNSQGIAVGNFNATNATPPVWGNANPDVIGVLVSGNNCHNNSTCGIAVSGRAITVDSNLVMDNGSAAGGFGILANVSYSRISANMISGAGYFGIDSGGAIESDITGNYVAGAVIGINPGGSQNIRVAGNFVQDCTMWAMTVYNVETDGAGGNFGLAANNLAITDNWIGWSSASAGGIYLIDAPQNVLVARNNFAGGGAAAIGMALWPHTDTIIVESNRWNNTQRFVCNPVATGALQQVQFPDIADAIMITAASAPIQSMVSLHQVATSGQITYVKITGGGSGYSHATISVLGSGSGFAGSAYICNGAVLGVSVTQAGSGYGATVTVVIAGDGTGASAVASVGLPVVEERQLRVACNAATQFARAGSSPGQENWTGFDFTVPANSEVFWVGTWGSWRALQFPAGDYLQFAGDGSLTLRSAGSADLILKPASGGHLRMCSATEPVGVMSVIGHGSPLGQIAAPPGSDFRNLDGGAGNTFWIKGTGQDATGWIAVA